MVNVYLTIIIVAALMLLDYYLTIKGCKLYKKYSSKFIESESYELNPLFQERINKSKYSLLHLLNVAVVCLLIYVFHYLSARNILGLTGSTFEAVQGALFSTFFYINSRHIKNILTFKAIGENPSMLSGKIKQSHMFALKMSQIDAYGMSIIFLAVFIFIPSYFTLGFVIGPLVTAFKHKAWMRVYLKKARDKKK